MMDSNWLPGLLGEGDDIRSYRPASADSPPSEKSLEEAAPEAEGTAADPASTTPADSSGQDENRSENAVTLEANEQASEAPEDVEREEEGDEADASPWAAGSARSLLEDLVEPDPDVEGKEPEGAARRRKRRTNGGVPTTTAGVSRWALPPVRRVETRTRRKPVDPDKLPPYLRGHPRFERQ